MLRNLCRDCFTSRFTFVSIKDKINQPLCYFCYAAKVKKSWVEYGGKTDAVREVVSQSLKLGKDAESMTSVVELKELDEDQMEAHISARVYVEGEVLDEELDTHVNISFGVCDNCSRAAGNYYEAIIQIRADKRPLFPDESEELSNFIAAAVGEEARYDSSVFITKIEELKTGKDFYLSSTGTGQSIMNRLAKKYGAKTKQTSKLVGRKDGRDLYRTTYLVRLPDWRSGDVVRIDSRYLVVLKLESSRLNAFDLTTRKTATYKSKQLKNVRVFRKEDVTYSAVVVSAYQNEITLLDPVTMETRVVIKPPGYTGLEEDAEEVPVYRIGEELLLA